MGRSPVPTGAPVVRLDRAAGQLCQVVVLVAATWSCAGCRSPSGNGHIDKRTESPVPLQENPDGNFILFVTNQSLERPEVDIVVTIDGRPAVNDTFRKSDHGSRREYRFLLDPGTHVIRSMSRQGEAVMEQHVEIRDRHWGLIAYYYSPGGRKGIRINASLDFRFSDEPIYFQ